MIKVINFLLCIFYVIIFLPGCRENTSYFNGKIITANDIQVTDTLVGEKIVLDSINSGIISLCDSFVFFYSHNMPDFQYYCFNIKTGKYISNFFPIGRGAGEFLNVTPIVQKYNENDEIKALFTAINEEKAGVFNITQSIKQKKTICDTIFNLRWSDKYTRSFISIFRYDDSTVLVHKLPEKITLDDNRYLLPQYLMINYHTGNIERIYDLYNEPGVYNPEAKDLNEDFYLSYNLIHPDRTKIVMLMTMLPQINILDVETGTLKGITISGSPGFEDLKECDDFRQYYSFSDVDDKYIYGLYIDKSYTDFKATVNTCMINVFDWEGNFVYKLYVGNGLDQIQIDSKNRIMYGVSLATEEVFQYLLPF